MIEHPFDRNLSPKHLKPGDQFSADGYDVVATLHYADGGGEVVVLNNNHNYFLVVVRPYDGELVQLEKAFRYMSDNDDFWRKLGYRDALAHAATLAVSR